jgi:CRISPR-associated endoribonuclease Cas6
MRVKIKLSGTKELLSINNQSMVNSFIHKCLGNNNEFHDSSSNYTVSGLRGGKWVPGTDKINFSNGGFISVSTIDNNFLNKLLIGLMGGDKFGHGVEFMGIDPISEKIYEGVNHFRTLTPILMKVNGNFLTFKDPNFITTLETRTKNKLNKINPDLNWDNFKINIEEHPKHKVKKILVKSVINHASDCQIDISGSKEVCELIYNIGLGQSCGSGFGQLIKTENIKLYR